MVNNEGLAALRAATTRGGEVWYVAAPLRPTEDEIESALDDDGYPYRTRAAAAVAVRTGNCHRALRWLRWLRRYFPEVTFIAPWVAAVMSGEDDADEAQRERGLRDDCRVVARCDGIVLCGGRVTGGMSRERGDARAVADITALGAEPPAGTV